MLGRATLGPLGAKLAPGTGRSGCGVHLGFVYMQQTKRGEALSLLREVLAAHPEHAGAQYELGKALPDEGNVAEAVPHLVAAARLNPQKDYVNYQLQAAYRKASRIEDADRELAIYKELKAQKRQWAVPRPDTSQYTQSIGAD